MKRSIKMKVIPTLLFLIATIVSCWGQSNDEKERAEYEQYVFDANMPEALNRFFHQKEISARYEINRSLNPFYLRGDFDGDKKIDYPLAIIETQTHKKGILIYHPATKAVFKLGAGNVIPNGYNDDNMDWMGAWHVDEKKMVGQGVTEERPPKLIGEAILTEKLESSSGIIYWDGKKYKWYQQGD